MALASTLSQPPSCWPIGAALPQFQPRKIIFPAPNRISATHVSPEFSYRLRAPCGKEEGSRPIVLLLNGSQSGSPAKGVPCAAADRVSNSYDDALTTSNPHTELRRRVVRPESLAAPRSEERRVGK